MEDAPVTVAADACVLRMRLSSVVDNQASQAIFEHFPIYKQLNLISRGGARKLQMDAYVDEVIAHADRLKRLLAEADLDNVGLIDIYRSWPKFNPSPTPVVEEHKFPAPHEKLTDWDAEAALTTDDLLGESDEVASDVIGKLSRDRRKRFTELLNVEMAELLLSRGGPKEDRKREQKIERLLGIFARVGEM